MNPTYQIVYWRDIPAQVKARQGRERTSRELSKRFQEVIDEAAMRGEMTSTDQYLEEWRSGEWMEAEAGSLSEVVERIAAELEAEYTPQRLRALKLNQGFEAKTESA